MPYYNVPSNAHLSVFVAALSRSAKASFEQQLLTAPVDLLAPNDSWTGGATEND